MATLLSPEGSLSSNPLETNKLEQAYRYCEWITYHHYENFPVASLILPKEKRPHIAAIYAFARSADDFADEARYHGRSLDLLREWRAALQACARQGSSFDPVQGQQQHPIFLALADTIRRFQLPVQLLDDLLTAFTMDVTKRRYANWEELYAYCRFSANPVGRLVLLVFGYGDPRLFQYSDHICTGLQMTNHWQDLSIDVPKRDLIYVPQTVLYEHEVSEMELKGQDPKHISIRFREMMRYLVERTRVEFEKGEPLLTYVRGPLRLELSMTLAGGRAILEKIERQDYNVYARRPVLSAADKVRMLIDALVH